MNKEKKILVNGKEYTKNELLKKANKELNIEVLTAIARIEEHIKVQDKANKGRFDTHEKFIRGIIFGLIGSVAGIVIALIKTFI